MPHSHAELPQAIQWHEQTLSLLDQTELPFREQYMQQKTAEDVWQSIKLLRVRGAPAIGVAAAYGLCVSLQSQLTLPRDRFLTAIRQQAEYLESARPTAVNLSWALKRMQNAVSASSELDTESLYQRLLQEAEAIHQEDRQLCLGIGEHGAPLITQGMGILTHCNAGALATSGIGTATAPMYLAHQRGVKFRVYSDETRPLLQGARITAWELRRSGLDVTLNTDNMAAYLMSRGLIDKVIVGTDRVAANGDVANKIGTLGVAILARHYGIPFYVACPSSTYDPFTATGADIEIEQREAGEVREFGGSAVAPIDVPVVNPAFDVTPSELVTGLITELGIACAPFRESMHALLGK